MKKANCSLLMILFLTFNLVHAQEEKESKFNIVAFSGIGYGIVDNENEPNYNLNTNNVEILLNYKIKQNFGIATGIGYNELSGNGFSSLGNFYHERMMLKIPFLVTLDYPASDHIRFVSNFGLYGQNIAKDEYRFLQNTQKDLYDGWNFGAQLGLGFVFKMFDNINAGVHFSGQSGFSNFNSNNNQGINDKQKMKNLSSIGVILLIDL